MSDTRASRTVRSATALLLEPCPGRGG